MTVQSSIYLASGCELAVWNTIWRIQIKTKMFFEISLYTWEYPRFQTMWNTLLFKVYLMTFLFENKKEVLKEDMQEKSVH